MDDPFNIFKICPKCKKPLLYYCNNCNIALNISKYGDSYTVDWFDFNNENVYFQTEYGILEEKITSNFIIKEFDTFQEVFDCIEKYYSNLYFE